MAKISVIYHHFPHYRAPVMRALTQFGKHDYLFFGGLEDFQGIRAFRGDDVVAINPITFLHDEATGKIDIADFEVAVSRAYDATIVIGNPNMRGAWRAVRQASNNGLGTAYWAHGWLHPESWVKSKIRNYFFSRADRVLTYGHRAHKIATASGFDSERISVIWNSLDWEAQSDLFAKHADTPLGDLRVSVGMPQDVPILMTISRVTGTCHYEWLVDSAARLRAENRRVELWIVGDGPALSDLVAQAERLNVPLYAQGALFDEALLARQIMAADVVASPGKLGLTGMHALAYGTPVVTHSDLDRQMPEIEAVEDGFSGSLFAYGSTEDLTRALKAVLDDPRELASRRAACRASLDGRFTPRDQARLIDKAMDKVFDVRNKRK